jgi:hypothetical protein
MRERGSDLDSAPRRIVLVLIAVICAWCDHVTAAPRVSHGICATHLISIREALGRSGREMPRTRISPHENGDPDPATPP